MTNKRFVSEILLQPPGLGRDILRACGLLVLAAVVFVLPPALLPWHVYRWVMMGLAVLGVWVILFMWVRMARQHRQWQTEDDARHAQRAAADVARAARSLPLDDTPGEKYGEGS